MYGGWTVPFGERLVRYGHMRSRLRDHRASVLRANAVGGLSELRPAALMHLRGIRVMRSRIVFSPIAAVFVAALASAMFAGPIVASKGAGIQGASVTHKPDASIRVVKSHYKPTYEHGFNYDWNPQYFVWKGVGVFNTTGLGQVAKADFQQNCCDETHTFSVSIRNDGNTSDRFKVHATGSGLTGWTVTYFRGTTNVTNAVRAGTFQTPLVAPGSQFLLKVRLSGKWQTETLAGSRLITVASSADPTKKDAVQLKLEQATWCYC